MNIDHDRGDAPRRLAIHHDRGGMLHGLALVAASLCFATSAMGAGASDAGEDEPPAGTEPDGACKSCGSQNEDNAKFCDQCGKSMAAAPDSDGDDDGDGDGDGDEGPDEAPRDEAPPPPKRAKVGPDAAYAELAGVPAASSLPVIKGGLAGRVNLALHVMSAFELSDPERAVSAFDVAFKDAARLPDLEQKLKAGDARAKLELGKKIVALRIEGYPRTDVLEDVVKDGKRTVRLTQEYRNMSLAALDEKHRRLAARTPARRDTPFEPDPARAADAARNVGAGDRSARLLAAKKSPAAQRMFTNPSNTRTLDEIAEGLVRTEDVDRGITAGGAS